MIRKIKKRLYSAWLMYLDFMYMIFKMFPIQPNKILFSSYMGKGFGDNSAAIALKLHEMHPEYKMKWVYKDDAGGFPEWMDTTKLNSILYMFDLATSKIWVDNARKPINTKKRKEQYYIQTWHGGIALKKVEADSETPLPDSWIRTSIHDSEMIDAMISNSTFCTEMYKRAFWYTGKIFEYGSPRSDKLYSDRKTTNAKVRKLLNIPIDNILVMYAPTFREDGRDVYDIDVERICSTIRDRENKTVSFVVRLHPLMNPKNYRICSCCGITDATRYPDMYELLQAADILITDYSSSMFDMLVLEKEVYLYASDLEEYSRNRGFYFDLSTLPFPLCENNQELAQRLRSYSSKIYMERLTKFKDKVGLKEYGDASEKVAKLIVDVIERGQD